ncbi:LuxR C-terminal-related transcriptional regulator [Limnobacter sp.]|uniref:LuxR C-terminal-related transcriptional regulator n=1 Tax=Limnobacter sp. TaxID=2003368 RepID=UPI00312044D8
MARCYFPAQGLESTKRSKIEETGVVDSSPRSRLFELKIVTPKPNRLAIERSALLQRIFRDNDPASVVIFQAPAGHGKTSLMLQVEQLCREQDFFTCWISLDESDNEVRRLMSYFQSRLNSYFQSLSRNSPDSGAAEFLHEAENSTDWVIEQFLAVGKPVGVFIDDLHTINNPATLRFIKDLIRSSPDRIRWFVSSRVLPDLNLSKLLLGEHILIINADELRFSKEETRKVFEVENDLDMSQQDVESIYKDTEGWPAVVQFYRLALQSEAFRSSFSRQNRFYPRGVTDYLAEHVLSQQDEILRSFLLRTSILSTMSSHLCDAVLERNDSCDVLAKLEREGFFVRRLESAEDWFSYHALFSGFLRGQFYRFPQEETSRIHLRAANWYRDNNHLEEALHHYVAARSFEDAVDVFDQWTETLVPDGHLITVDNWFDRLPLDEMLKRPGVVVKLSWVFMFLSRHEKLAKTLPSLRVNLFQDLRVGDPAVALALISILQDEPENAMDYLMSVDLHEPSNHRFRIFELSAVYNIRGYISMAKGQFDTALACFAYSRTLSEQADATFTLAYSLAKSGLSLMFQGHLQDALVHLESSMREPVLHLEESVSKACLACSYIAVLYECDALDEALAQFEQFEEIIENAAIHDYLIICYRAVSRIYQRIGQYEKALKILTDGERLALSGRWPRAAVMMGHERVRFELLHGSLTNAQLIFARLNHSKVSDKAGWVRFSEEIDGARISQIRLLYHEGKLEEAMGLAEQALLQAGQESRVLRQIKLHALVSLCQASLGHLEHAHISLHNALTLAAPGQFLGVFLDEGEALDSLICRHLQWIQSKPQSVNHHHFLNYLSRLISKLPSSLSQVLTTDKRLMDGKVANQSGFEILDALTSREQEVLRLLLMYKTNDQIAQDLYVSRATVKYHLRNIFSKMGVKSRLEAIRLGQLIPAEYLLSSDGKPVEDG